MLVRDVMQTKLISVTPQSTLPEALKLVAQRRVRHLPVVDPGGDLLGPLDGSVHADRPGG